MDKELRILHILALVFPLQNGVFNMLNICSTSTFPFYLANTMPHKMLFNILNNNSII